MTIWFSVLDSMTWVGFVYTLRLFVRIGVYGVYGSDDGMAQHREL